MKVCCPHCGIGIHGGMTLVRHICAAHGIAVEIANQEVDDIFRKLNGMNFNPQNPLTFDAPGHMSVSYEHLTAKQCENLKKSVINKEEEFTWKTFGANRNEILEEHPISHLSNQHLENILITQPQIPNDLAAAILMLLKKRYGVL